MKPGLYRGLAWSEYAAIDAVSHSTLKLFERTPAHAREAMLHPRASTATQSFGQATHAAILEPERFSREYTAAPKMDRRTKAGKSEWAEFEEANKEKEIITADEFEQCQRMIEAVAAHKIARELLASKGENELTVVWVDAETGLLCKGRLDRFVNFQGYAVILDLKTTDNAEELPFLRSVVKYGYHSQGAFYLDGMDAVAKAERRFWNLAIEKSPPFAIRLFELGDASIEQGRRNYRRWLRAYKRCKETNEWPGYPDGLEELELPKWAFESGIAVA